MHGFQFSCTKIKSFNSVFHELSEVPFYILKCVLGGGALGNTEMTAFLVQLSSVPWDLVPRPSADTKCSRCSSPFSSMAQCLHGNHSHHAYILNHLWTASNTWCNVHDQTVITLPCSENKERKKRLYMFTADVIFPLNIFNLWLVEHMDAEPTDMERQLSLLIKPRIVEFYCT